MNGQGASQRRQLGASSASMPLEHLLALSEVPLFQSLSRRQLRRVVRLVERRRYTDEVVVRAGGRGDAFYVILDGRATLEGPHGHLETLSPGDTFGELALLDGAPRAASVSAAGELIVGRIARPAFQRLVAEEPGLDVGLIRGVVAILREMQEGTVPADPSSAESLLDAAPAAAVTDLTGPTSLGWLSTLRQVPLFHDLSGRHLGRIIRLAELRRYAADAVVVRAGAPGDAFHIILDGRARADTPEGDERIMLAGDSFGELALIDGAPRAATVSALDDLTTARLPRTAFLRVLREEPAVASGVLRGLVRIVREVEADMAPTPPAS